MRICICKGEEEIIKGLPARVTTFAGGTTSTVRTGHCFSYFSLIKLCSFFLFDSSFAALCAYDLNKGEWPLFIEGDTDSVLYQPHTCHFVYGWNQHESFCNKLSQRAFQQTGHQI